MMQFSLFTLMTVIGTVKPKRNKKLSYGNDERFDRISEQVGIQGRNFLGKVTQAKEVRTRKEK